MQVCKIRVVLFVQDCRSQDQDYDFVILWRTAASQVQDLIWRWIAGFQDQNCYSGLLAPWRIVLVFRTAGSQDQYCA